VIRGTAIQYLGALCLALLSAWTQAAWSGSDLSSAVALDVTPPAADRLRAHQYAGVLAEYSMGAKPSQGAFAALTLEYREPVVILGGEPKRDSGEVVRGVARFGALPAGLGAASPETIVHRERFSVAHWRRRDLSYVLKRDLGLEPDDRWYSAQSRSFFSLQRRLSLPLTNTPSFNAIFKSGTGITGINLRIRVRGARDFIAHWAHPPRSSDPALGDIYRLDLYENARSHGHELGDLELTEIIFLLPGVMSSSAVERFVGYELRRGPVHFASGLPLPIRVEELRGNRFRMVVDQRAISESWAPRVLEKAVLTLPRGAIVHDLRFVSDVATVPSEVRVSSPQGERPSLLTAVVICAVVVASLGFLSTVVMVQRWSQGARLGILGATVGTAFGAFALFSASQRIAGQSALYYVLLQGLLTVAAVLTAYAAALAMVIAAAACHRRWSWAVRLQSVDRSLTLSAMLSAAAAGAAALLDRSSMAEAFTFLAAGSMALAALRMAVDRRGACSAADERLRA